MEAQHIMLKSGACHNLFPDNTNASFKNKLGKRLNTINGQWEVALLEARYPQNWDNVREGRLTLHYERRSGDESSEAEPHDRRCTLVVARVPSGRYRRVDGVVRAINDAIRATQFKDMIEFEHDSDAARVSVRFRSRIVLLNEGMISPGLSVSRDLSRLLGFDDDVQYSPVFSRVEEVSFRARRPPDPDAGMYSLLIYCSLVNERVVGDADVAVLRSTPVRGGKSMQAYEEYLTPHYLPAVSVDTDVVEVHIRDEEGKLVPFEGGTVDLSLFLRPVGSGRTP
jgi:hypothetical protein